MYYLLDYSVEDTKQDMWFQGTIYNNKKKIVEETFSSGKNLDEDKINAPFTIILDEKESSLKKKIAKDKISTSVIESGFLFLISPATQAFFKKLNVNNLQYFDVHIKSSILEIKDYKIVNVIDKIDCIDLSASEAVLYPNQNIKKITSLILDETKIPKEKQIFLLGRKSVAVILVHENIKKAIEETKLTGFKFFTLDKARKFF